MTKVQQFEGSAKCLLTLERAMSMALALLIGACDRAEAPLLSIPPVLIQHLEPPVGTELNGQLVWASQQALELLQPDWVHLNPAIYTAYPADLKRIVPDVRAAVPTGWKELDASNLAISNGEIVA